MPLPTLMVHRQHLLGIDDRMHLGNPKVRTFESAWSHFQGPDSRGTC